MAAEKLHVLFEHASGYGLFGVAEYEEVGAFSKQVEDSVRDASKFQSVVSLVAFSAFVSGQKALENVVAVSEGNLHDDLRAFLDANMPKTGKHHRYTLGVQDPALGRTISQELNISCDHTGAVPEIIRGIRLHLHCYLKNMTQQQAVTAQLGLGHSYSRTKVQFNVNRVDNMIIQSISLLDQLDKDINTFSMRIREWYSYHFPELIKIVPDNYTYAKVVNFIKTRNTLSEASIEPLEDIIQDSTKARAILDASKSSMGMELSEIDFVNIERFTERVVHLADYRRQLQQYLLSRMHNVAPNLSTLIGEQVGARLISHAGSLTNLAKYPASTVQILGAEKALFRALKTRGNTPKYGLIFHSTFIGRAATKNKGRISRYLANKCSLASRIDCFADIPTDIFGTCLRQQVEDRLKFYETGEIPKKNVDVMSEANELAKKKAHKIEKKLKKERKRKKLEEAEAAAVENQAEEVLTEPSPPKKKKKKHAAEPAPETPVVKVEVPVVDNEITAEPSESTEGSVKKKKKKKRQSLPAALEAAEDTSMNVNGVEDEVTDATEVTVKKKKKKRKSQ